MRRKVERVQNALSRLNVLWLQLINHFHSFLYWNALLQRLFVVRRLVHLVLLYRIHQNGILWVELINNFAWKAVLKAESSHLLVREATLGRWDVLRKLVVEFVPRLDCLWAPLPAHGIKDVWRLLETLELPWWITLLCWADGTLLLLYCLSLYDEFAHGAWTPPHL